MLSSKFCDTIVNSLKAHFNIDCLDIKLEYYNNYRTHFSLVCEDTVNTGYFGMDVEFNRLILEPNEIKNFSVYAQTDDYQTFGSYFKKCIFLEPFLSSIESINNSIIMPKHNDISMSLMNKANPYKYNLFNGTTYIVDEIVQFNSINSVYNDYHIRYIDTINGSSTIAQISIIDKYNFIITVHPPKKNANQQPKEFKFKRAEMKEMMIFFKKIMYLSTLYIDYEDISILDGIDIDDKETLHSILEMFSI